MKELPVRGETYVWNIEGQTAYFLQSELEGQDTKTFTNYNIIKYLIFINNINYKYQAHINISTYIFRNCIRTYYYFLSVRIK